MAKMFVCAAAALLCSAVCASIQPAAALEAPHRHSAHLRRNIVGRAGLAAQPLRAPTIPDWTVQYGEIKGGASGSLGAMLEGRNPANGLP